MITHTKMKPYKEIFNNKSDNKPGNKPYKKSG